MVTGKVIYLRIQSILRIFSEFDSINFLRYGSLYLEQMRRLLLDYLEVYKINL